MTTVSPHRHACGPHDIDYGDPDALGQVKDRCTVCGRVWTMVLPEGGKSWYGYTTMIPFTREKPDG